MDRAGRVVLVVPPASAGMRLDRLVATLPEVGTRSRAKQLVDQGLVRVDGEVRKTAHQVRAGTKVEVDVPSPEPSRVEPEDLPLRILYEDEHLLAIDKPPGLVVHPAPGARRGTLVNALVHHLGTLAGVGDPERPGIVHRLDRDTSGVLLVARTAAALEGLARQFRARAVDKRYLAIVRGSLKPATGTIDRPIGRHPRERQRMSIRSQRGRAAVTHWTVLERFRDATLVRLRPETGRTHQLRVHLAALGHPILGDRVYGARRAASSRDPASPRQALHAEEIGFAHPTSGERVVVRAALPADFETILAALRQGCGTTGNSARPA